MIFRRQLVYFIVLLLVEVPYTAYVLMMGRITPYLSDPYYMKIFQKIQPYFGGIALVFLSRGILLAIIRLTEPQFLTRLQDVIFKKMYVCFERKK